MTSSIPIELRRLVDERASSCCEYCLIPQVATIHNHEPDHIIPSQHGGTSEEHNLALACMRCNRFKGPNLGSIDPKTEKLVPFFNPRKQIWSEHFGLENGIIHPLTPEGRVTAKILRFNDEDRVEKRLQLLESGIYPLKMSK